MTSEPWTKEGMAAVSTSLACWTQAFQEGHLDPEPLCSHRHDLGARALPAAGVVDPQVPRARAHSIRMHFVVAYVGANPLVVCNDLQLHGGNHEARDLFRVLREQANRTLKMLRHLLALSDRLELRVVHHHCGEERGQFPEGVVDKVIQGQLRERATTADPPERTTFVATFSTKRSLGPPYTPIRNRRRRRGKSCFKPHSPQVREPDVLERLSARSMSAEAAEKPTEVANSSAMRNLHVACWQACAVCPNQ